MKFNNLKQSIVAQWSAPRGNTVVPLILGKPGGGKSSCAREIAAVIAKTHKIPEERIVEFNPSLREPSDILGLPDLSGACSRWVPPEEFYALRAGVGPAILIIEELSDATMDMQNPLCRVILDRCAGQMKLTDQLYIIATGNRTEDRSGASRLSTKLANRMRILSFDEDLDDWCAWAHQHDIDPVLVAFIRFRPELLSKFDPSAMVNPTPRSWEDASRIPTDMDSALYVEHLKGAVGDGAAAEYMGFRKIYTELPDVNAMLKAPTKATIPTTPAVQYALTAKLLSMVDEKAFPKIYKVMNRLPPEFMIMFMKDAAKRYKWLSSTGEFQDFAMKNVNLLI